MHAVESLLALVNIGVGKFERLALVQYLIPHKLLDHCTCSSDFAQYVPATTRCARVSQPRTLTSDLTLRPSSIM